MSNRLFQEKSPYLLQHRENPVDWYPWCVEAFRKAEMENKPVFLSIGYSTCHWCHVMAHESFEDIQVAQILNREFVSIKVDREERPDIDAVYMSVCQALTGSGGWPLSILMTPDQKPFWAGTYLPKIGMYGRLGLMELLEQAAVLWKNDRERLVRAGNQITDAIVSMSDAVGKAPNRLFVEKAFAQLKSVYSRPWGGFGSAPKFPTPHNLLFLLCYGQQTQDKSAFEMVERTLDAMERGGIHDQIGGGFSRYSTDERWLVPHFEKMLYDNALLLMAYSKAYQYTKKERYADVAHRTAGYILGELTSGEGGCYCGQDADSDGIEGKYYVFTPEEVESVLADVDGAEFCRLYDITDTGNFEGKSIPNRIHTAQPPWARDDPRLKKLYEYRRTRTRLHKDDKVLLSWNAWTVIGLTRASVVLEEPRYLDASIRIHRFIQRKMTDENGRLFLRYAGGEAAHAGQLEDYAVYALALLELYRATFDVNYLHEAIQKAEQMMELFEDRENGGYYLTAEDGEKLIARPKETYDGALPSGNSAAAAVLQTLASLTGEQKWQEACLRQLSFLAGAIEDHPSGSCFGLLAMMGALYPHRELVCCSANGIPEDIMCYLKEKTADDIQIILKTSRNAQQLSHCAPFTQAYPVPEKGEAYYLCEDGACKAPVQSFGQLKL